MEDKYSLVRQHSGIWKSLRDGDFEEEEVWAVLKDRPYDSSGVLKPMVKESSPLPVPRPLPTATRMIPIRASSNNSSASSSHEAKVLQQSAPVNIPDWSKIYRNKQNKAPKNVSRIDDFDFYHSVVVDDGGGGGVVNYDGDSDDDEDDDDDDDDEYDPKLPPHEFIARRIARSQISSFSVFEGVGRTLKGRDLSKVRNAILNKTGFLESL